LSIREMPLVSYKAPDWPHSGAGPCHAGHVEPSLPSSAPFLDLARTTPRRRPGSRFRICWMNLPRRYFTTYQWRLSIRLALRYNRHLTSTTTKSAIEDEGYYHGCLSPVVILCMRCRAPMYLVLSFCPYMLSDINLVFSTRCECYLMCLNARFRNLISHYVAGPTLPIAVQEGINIFRRT